MNPTETADPPAPTELKKKDFVSDQTVRWCPGCGDYAILASMQKTLATLGIPREKFVMISGIGCSSRFPYYMNTYGFHTIHGRAPAFATGLKVARPDLSVWVITGDGDALSIGGNHLLHAMRRNVDLKVILFNNKIYGLTKGQYSPTSEQGLKTKTSPFGAPDRPINPVSIALAAEATFVARTADTYGQHMQEVFTRAAHHHGSAFIEVFQNCVIVYDGAFEEVASRKTRDDTTVRLEHGKPLIFGKDSDKGVRLNGLTPEVVDLEADNPDVSGLLHHDERAADPTLAYLLSQMERPTPVGVFRSLEEETYDDAVHRQIQEARAASPATDLDALLRAGDSWEIQV